MCLYLFVCVILMSPCKELHSLHELEYSYTLLVNTPSLLRSRGRVNADIPEEVNYQERKETHRQDLDDTHCHMLIRHCV